MFKTLILTFCIFITYSLFAQQIPNGDFKKWGNDYDHCPTGWGCNNEADCNGKITQADKIKGGARLTVIHCFDPARDDRSNNISLNFDNLSAKIPKGKKVKISFDYSYSPVNNDIAYIKIDADMEEEQGAEARFFYNDLAKGTLKPIANGHLDCYLNFDPLKGKNYIAPQSLSASSIRTTFGIMPAEGSRDVNKGSSLIINRVKFEIE